VCRGLQVHTDTQTRIAENLCGLGASMKIAIAGGIIFLLALGMYIGLRISDCKWAGVDESVVEKFAIEANRPPQAPLINIERGDLPSCCFF